MSSNSKLTYSVVIEEGDGSLVCNCHFFSQTGKACMHILAARMQRDFGCVENYLEIETVRIVRGRDAKGVSLNPKKEGRGGRREQARSDGAVEKELESFFEGLPMEVEESAKNTKTKKAKKDDLDTKEQGDNVKAAVSSGRPPKTAPLHSGRSATNLSALTGIGQPVLFKKKTGPKPKPHLSLLPALKTSYPVTPSKKPINFSPQKVDPHLGFAPPTLKEVDLEALKTILFPVDDPAALQIARNEEIEMELLSFDRWEGSHMLRQDEIGAVVDILNYLNAGIGGHTLVIADTYAQPASLLKDVDWTLSDTPPTDHSGKPFFSQDSLIGRSWTYSRARSMNDCLIFHHSASANHWLLFRKCYRQMHIQQDLVVYEPLRKHGRRFDIQNLSLIAQFFNPLRGDIMPSPGPVRNYDVRTIDVQEDGHSCGFWAITFALLLVCGLEIEGNTQKELKAIGLSAIKDYWKKIWISFRSDEGGLQKVVLQPFLANFSAWNGFEDLDGMNTIVARRPDWISRHPTGNIDPVKVATPLKSDSMAVGHSQFKLPMKKPSFFDIPEFDILKESSQSLFLGREQLKAEDLLRLLPGCFVNDELINMWRQVMLKIYGHGDSSKTTSFHITSTFFFHQVSLWAQSQDGDQETNDKLWNAAKRSLGPGDILNCYLIFIPINKPEELHWLLAVINFSERTIKLYDSWQATQKINSTAQQWDDSVGADIIQILIAWLQREARSHGQKFRFSDWNFFTAGYSKHVMPTQDNGTDCGIFVMLFIYHILHFGGVNKFPTTSIDDKRLILNKDNSGVKGIGQEPSKLTLVLPTPLADKDLPNTVTADLQMPSSPLTSIPEGSVVSDSEPEMEELVLPVQLKKPEPRRSARHIAK
ncbi:hypothetical protein BDZ97DRAFT_1915273 [Flammula alnicola]|nr:hypothetical protein BDZ97DRAFT_1915273 [Flammula alnicola]